MYENMSNTRQVHGFMDTFCYDGNTIQSTILFVLLLFGFLVFW